MGQTQPAAGLWVQCARCGEVKPTVARKLIDNRELRYCADCADAMGVSSP